MKYDLDDDRYAFNSSLLRRKMNEEESTYLNGGKNQKKTKRKK